MRKVLRLICRPPGRIVRDADRYPELRLRRAVHDGALGCGRRGRQARPDDPARRQAASARGVLALRAAPMRSSLAFSVLVLVATGTGAPAQPAAAPCHGTQQSRTVAELLFGRNIGRSIGVSESDWAGFVAREMAPRFPDGLT